jgi:serine/threonine protein kinase
LFIRIDAMTDRSALPVGYKIANYEVVRTAGRGGFAFVYEAYNEAARQRVAIKEFYPSSLVARDGEDIAVLDEDDRELVEDILRRFEREARIQIDLDHPHLIKVRDFFSANNTGYIVTEYLEGEILPSYLNRQDGHFRDYSQFKTMMRPIADAIHYLHRKSILHGDIAPENIFLDRRKGPVLIDLGSAERLLDGAATTKTRFLTFRDRYSALEIRSPAAERPEGFYSDIFALAGTFYSGLSGDDEFLIGPVQRALSSTDPYVPVSNVSRITCPARVYNAIDRGLALSFRERPGSTAEFIEMLGWGGNADGEEWAWAPGDAPPPIRREIDPIDRSKAPKGVSTDKTQIARVPSLHLPKQAPAPVRVEFREGKIGQVQDARGSRLLSEARDFDAWREPVASHVRELLAGDLRQGTNHSRARERLLGIDKLLAGSVDDVNERQFRLGYEIERLRGLIAAYRSSADDLPAMSGVVLEDLDRLNIGLQVGASKLERWVDFVRSAKGEPERQVRSDVHAVGEALDAIATELEQQSKYFHPELPVTFRFLAESVKDPLGATKTVVYGAVKSAENLISFLGEKSLEIGKSSAEAVNVHMSKAVAVTLITSLSSAALQLSGALPTAWAWLRPLLDALSKGHLG